MNGTRRKIVKGSRFSVRCWLLLGLLFACGAESGAREIYRQNRYDYVSLIH